MLHMQKNSDGFNDDAPDSKLLSGEVVSGKSTRQP
jgi:hypothetical protein